MLWHSLLQLAKDIAAAAQDDDPNDVRLRCATSRAYYAAFHCLSQNAPKRWRALTREIATKRRGIERIGHWGIARFAAKRAEPT